MFYKKPSALLGSNSLLDYGFIKISKYILDSSDLISQFIIGMIFRTTENVSKFN